MNHVERRDAQMAYISDESILRTGGMQEEAAEVKLYGPF